MLFKNFCICLSTILLQLTFSLGYYVDFDIMKSQGATNAVPSENLQAI